MFYQMQINLQSKTLCVPSMIFPVRVSQAVCWWKPVCWKHEGGLGFLLYKSAHMFCQTASKDLCLRLAGISTRAFSEWCSVPQGDHASQPEAVKFSDCIKSAP